MFFALNKSFLAKYFYYIQPQALKLLLNIISKDLNFIKP